MSNTSKPLKSQNMKFIISILSFDICIISLSLNHLNIILPFLWTPLLSIGASATTVAIFALAANHLLPRWMKEIIVFLRFKNTQPGCRAFSVHANKDKRIDVSSLKKSIGRFPILGSKQNALWYKLLKQNEDKASVRYAHKNYLLFRDIASLSFIFCILVSLPLLVYNFCSVTVSLFGWLLFQYLLCMIAAQNSGNSLVDNVLAEASSTVIT